jgi:hypothetical protein
MSNSNANPRNIVLIVMILLAASYRLMQSSPIFSILSNLTPIGAVALFGGHYFRHKWKAILVPLLALAISDLLLNRFYYYDHWVFYYEGMLWVYGAFAATVALGMFMGRATLLRVISFGVGAAVLHWFVTDLGLWMGGGIDITTGVAFTKDWNGFVRCLALALPFLRNMIIGNIVFCGVLFGSFEWMSRRYPTLSRG